jgi:hypothetical protein
MVKAWSLASLAAEPYKKRHNCYKMGDTGSRVMTS